MNDKQAGEMVRERRQLAYQYFKNNIAQTAIENDQLYHNYIDETSHPYLSNIALPWPYIIVESYLGKCIQIMAAHLPYVRVVEEDDDSRPKAKKVEKDINMDMYRQKWPILAYNIYKQGFKYGTAFPMATPWTMIDGKEMTTFRLLPFFKTWVNPNVLSLEDEDAYLIYEDYVPRWSILKKYSNNPYYKNLNKIKVHEGETRNEEEKSIDSFKESAELPYDKYSELVKIWVYWSHDDFIIVTNENNVIRNDGSNPLDGVIPVFPITPIPLEDEFYGMSILEQGKGLFAECNENRNQYNDAVNLMLNPQWIVDRNAGINKVNFVARTGGMLFTEDVNGIIPMKVDWNILPNSIARNTLLTNDIQNFSNAFPQMRGAPTPGIGTATEFMGMRSAGELRSDTYNLILSMMSIETFAKAMVDFKKMFMTEPNQFYYWPEDQTQGISPNDYAGKFSFKAFAGYKMSREIERKQLIEAMTMIFGNQAFLPLVMPKVNEWLERLIDYFDLRSPEQLYVTDKETKDQQMNQFKELIRTMMGGGGNQVPALGEREMRMPESTPNSPFAQLTQGVMPNV